MLITFRYNLDELRELGLEQDHLRPAYFSTTTNSWTVPDGYVIDKTTHEITLWIDHFTRYGVIGVESKPCVFAADPEDRNAVTQYNLPQV